MASPSEKQSGNTVAPVSCNEGVLITGIAISIEPAFDPRLGHSALLSAMRKVYGLKPGSVHRVRNVRLGQTTKAAVRRPCRAKSDLKTGMLECPASLKQNKFRGQK